jgi:hypothetical protein
VRSERVPIAFQIAEFQAFLDVVEVADAQRVQAALHGALHPLSGDFEGGNPLHRYAATVFGAGVSEQLIANLQTPPNNTCEAASKTLLQTKRPPQIKI